MRKQKEYALHFLDGIRERPVYPTREALDRLNELDHQLQDEPLASDEILKQLNEYGSPTVISYNHGCYHGFVNGGVIPATLPAKWLIDVWDSKFSIIRYLTF